MTKNLKWRLAKLPTPEEVMMLVRDKLITNEEARDILFAEKESVEDSDELKSEIKFLRELLEKLASKTTLVETIKHVIPNYTGWHWYQPYWSWTTSGATYLTTTTGSGSTGMYVDNGSSAALDLSDIKTF